MASASPPTDELQPLVDGTALALALDLNALNRCNVSCTMCPFAVKYDDLGETLPPYYRLTLHEYRTLTAGLRVRAAHFVGAYAEPLMNKEIFDLVAFANGQGTQTAITSNGTLLSEAFATRLIDAGLDLLTISLHGATKEVAESIMRGADFDRVVSNIRTLQRLKQERRSLRPTLQFNFVAQRRNIDDLPAFVRLAASLDVRTIHCIHLLDGAAEVDGRESLVHHPDLLIHRVAEARSEAATAGVFLSVSPAYQAVIDVHSAPQAQEPCGAA